MQAIVTQNSLQFSDEEIKEVEEVTQDQWQCDTCVLYIHNAGFITASKCKDDCSRQTTLEKNGPTKHRPRENLLSITLSI